jgi:transposase
LLNTLVEKGKITPIDVMKAVGNRIKRPLEEIESAVCGTLIQSECRLLERLLKKLDDCQNDIDAILPDMLYLAYPLEISLEQLDSIPGIDVVAALAILAEISNTPPMSPMVSLVDLIHI